jgi:Adenosine deaminase
MDPSPFDRLLARALILWDERVEHSYVPNSAWDLQAAFPAHFYGEFASEAGRISRTDVEHGVAYLLKTRPELVMWYETLIAPSVVEIEWRECQPFISPQQVGTWERLANEFDPDALLTADLARRFGVGDRLDDLAELQNWQTVPRVGDHELSVMQARGLSDLHIHVGGVRIAQATWQEIMAGEAATDTYRTLKEIYDGASRKLTPDMEAARAARNTLLHLALDAQSPTPLPRSTAEQWWRWSPRILSEERRMLVSSWAKLASSEDEAGRILPHLDAYLLHKHRFHRLVRQPIFTTTPGLRHFDARYFRALQHKAGARHAPAASTYGRSTRLQMTPTGDACAYLLESKALRRIELRIAPLERASRYHRFFGLWHELKQQIDRHLAKEGIGTPHIRFAVHFKRSREQPKGARVGDGTYAHAAQKLQALDRHTAALRAALSNRDKRFRTWMSALARVDVAGQERDTPAALFAPHLRLLRGDSDMLRFLETAAEGEPFHRWLRYWKRLQKLGTHRPPLGDPLLGVTVHAGEDYADLLDGLFQVGVAVDALRLRAGDGIGHGLALTSAFEADGLRSPSFVMIPIGAAFDSLCWLLDFIETRGQTRLHHVECGALRTQIMRGAEMIYSPEFLREQGLDVDDHIWVWRSKFAPDRADWQRAGQQRQALIELDQEMCTLVVRERPMPADRQRRELDGAVQWAQTTLLAEIRDKRIVIEMNPTSNVRISGAPSPGRMPTVKLFQAVANGLLACINTDNPGVFASCIENEYALLLDGAREAGTPESTARDLLEQVRRIGMEVVYWPNWRDAGQS